MNDKIKEILDMIVNKGFEAYVIGGYPRDYLLGKNSNDYDICTNAHPDDIISIFNDVISSNYGSTKVKFKNNIYEITTFRREGIYIDNRRPSSIEYVNSLIDDLNRRDFTINTICMDRNNNIIDLLNGRKDLSNKIIKVVGDPEFKIKEDALRILRAIRFATVLNFKLSNDLYLTIKKCGYLVKDLSYERKKNELDKIFASEFVMYGINLIKELNLDKYLELDFSDIKKTSLYGIWAQVNPHNYKFSKIEKNEINKINELRKLNVLNNYNLYKYGLSISIIVGKINNISEELIRNKYNSLPIKNIKDIKIDLKKINIKEKKNIIFDIEKKILSSELINNSEEILKYIKKTYKIICS